MKTKKTMCKTIVLIMVIVMITSMFVSCKKSSEDTKQSTGTTVKENIVTSKNVVESDKKLAPEGTTFTMLYSDNASYQYREDWLILSEIKRLTNVDLKLIPVPESDYATKRQVIINSGDMPDIISKTIGSSISEYALNGLFLPISDYEDQMPNYKNFIDKYDYKLELDNQREANNKYYMLPIRARTWRINTHIWLARVDLFEKHGLELPKTMNDILEAGKVLKKAYPNSTPITNRFFANNILSMIAPAFGTRAGWCLGNSGFILDEEKNEWIFAPASNEYKEMLMYMNELVNAGVLDKEFTTLDSNVYEQRVINGTNFILADWVGNEIRYNKAGKENNPDFNVQPIFPPKGPKGYALGHASKFEQSWVIPAKVKEKDNFDVFLKFVDWFYTDEAALVTSFGKEGVSFNFVGGKPVFIDAIKNGEIDPSKEYGINNNCLTVREHDDLFGAFKTDEIVKLYEEMDKAGCIQPPQPNLKLTAAEREEVKLYSSALTDYYSQMTEKFILGKESFNNWDAFVAEAEKKGAEKLRKLYNDVWARQTNTK